MIVLGQIPLFTVICAFCTRCGALVTGVTGDTDVRVSSDLRIGKRVKCSSPHDCGASVESASRPC